MIDNSACFFSHSETRLTNNIIRGRANVRKSQVSFSPIWLVSEPHIPINKLTAPLKVCLLKYAKTHTYPWRVDGFFMLLGNSSVFLLHTLSVPLHQVSRVPEEQHALVLTIIYCSTGEILPYPYAHQSSRSKTSQSTQWSLILNMPAAPSGFCGQEADPELSYTLFARTVNKHFHLCDHFITL